jgi:hypothetical protein
MTATITDRPPEGAGLPRSYPRPGFDNPGSALTAALIFRAEGGTAAYFLGRVHPEDRLLAELVAELDKIEADEVTPQDCREIIAAADETLAA